MNKAFTMTSVTTGQAELEEVEQQHRAPPRLAELEHLTGLRPPAAILEPRLAELEHGAGTSSPDSPRPGPPRAFRAAPPTPRAHLRRSARAHLRSCGCWRLADIIQDERPMTQGLSYRAKR